MQVILEKPVSNPDRTDRTNVFGVHEYGTTCEPNTDTQSTRLYWPYHAALETTEHTARPIAGTNTAYLTIDELTELIVQPYYAANTVLVLGEEYNTIERALQHLTTEQKEAITIIRENDNIPVTNENKISIDFFNTTGE